MWKIQAWHTQLKALDMSSATVQVAGVLLKTLAILSDTTVRRLWVEWEDLKPIWKWKIKAIFLQMIQQLFISFSKTLLATKRQLTWWKVLVIDFSSTYLNIGTIGKTFQWSRKEDSFRYILKKTQLIWHKDLGSQLFRATITIQSSYLWGMKFGYEQFRRCVIVMQSQINFRRKSRLRDTWVIKIGVIKKDFSKHFCLVRCRRHLRTFKYNSYNRYSRFTIKAFLAVGQNLCEPSFWKMKGFVFH